MELVIPGREGRWVPEMHGTRDAGDVPVTFTKDTGEAINIIKNLGPGVIAMDTETVFAEKVDPMTAQLRVISIATEDENGQDIAYVFDVKDMDRIAIGEAFRARAKELGVRRLQVYGFNANFDDPVTTFGLTSQAPYTNCAYDPLLDWVDLMFAVSLPRLGAFGHTWISLAKASKQYLGIDLDGKGSTQTSYDAVTELNDEQIQYAAEDAIVTLWIADAVRTELEEANLLEPFTLEVRSRAFLSAMTINGMAFDQEGWMEHLETIKDRSEELLAQIAEITGGQPTLFGPPKPDFNPDSPDGLRKALNKHCPELVKEYLISQGEDGRADQLFQPYDSADKVTLTLMKVFGARAGMDTTLVELLVEYSSTAKIRQTYGEKMMALLQEDGRFHPEFTQCLIATGRTSSKHPNAQNFSPLMKPFFTPPNRVDENGVEHRRVLIQGDYSQAELRVSAQLTGEPVRRGAFADGEDQHAVVAGQMFQVDMKELLETEEGSKRYKSFRSRAKTINFGLGYGMKAGLLGSTLTQQGIITSKEEAAKLISDFFKALPKEAAWLQKRDDSVERRAHEIRTGVESGVPVDFDLTFRLYRLKKQMAQQTKELKKSGVNKPSTEYLATEYYRHSRFNSDEERQAAVEALTQHYDWAEKYAQPIVLRADGNPWEFYSVTLAKRRRVFQVPTRYLLETLSESLARPGQYGAQVHVDRWAAENHVTLSENPHRIDDQGNVTRSSNRRNLTFSVLKKTWERAGQHMREDFVFTMLKLADQAPPRQVTPATRAMPLSQIMLRDAMARHVSRLANAYRNAPIQGSVADAVLRAFATLADLMDKFPTAMPVSTVHDSIVVECDIEDARALSAAMQELMEEALAAYVPDVKVVADLDILSSLDDKNAIPEEELDQAIAA